MLSVVLFSFTEECKQISDVTNLKNYSRYYNKKNSRYAIKGFFSVKDQ